MCIFIMGDARMQLNLMIKVLPTRVGMNRPMIALSGVHEPGRRLISGHS
jgi:hypothetical protein